MIKSEVKRILFSLEMSCYYLLSFIGFGKVYYRPFDHGIYRKLQKLPYVEAFVVECDSLGSLAKQITIPSRNGYKRFVSLAGIIKDKSILKKGLDDYLWSLRFDGFGEHLPPIYSIALGKSSPGTYRTSLFYKISSPNCCLRFPWARRRKYDYDNFYMEEKDALSLLLPLEPSAQAELLSQEILANIPSNLKRITEKLTDVLQAAKSIEGTSVDFSQLATKITDLSELKSIMQEYASFIGQNILVLQALLKANAHSAGVKTSDIPSDCDIARKVIKQLRANAQKILTASVKSKNIPDPTNHPAFTLIKDLSVLCLFLESESPESIKSQLNLNRLDEVSVRKRNALTYLKLLSIAQLPCVDSLPLKTPIDPETENKKSKKVVLFIEEYKKQLLKHVSAEYHGMSSG